MARKLCRTAMAMPEMRPVRFGIVGCGTASIPVCEAIADSPITELADVYDVNLDMARDIGQRFQFPVIQSFNDLLDNTYVDEHYIAVQHYFLSSITQKVFHTVITTS